MKKLLLVVISTAACALTASPVGNPASPSMYKSGVTSQEQSDFSLRAGYLGDFVTHRKLQAKSTGHSNKETAKFKRNFNGLEATFNFNDRIDIVGRLGYANHTFLAPENAYRFKTRNDLSYGIGARGAVFEMDNYTVSVHGHYSRDNSTINKFMAAGGQVVNVKSQKVKLRDKTWTVGATVSQQMDNITPYAGVQYVKNRLSFSKAAVNGQPLMGQKNRKEFGAVAGVGLVHNEKASLNLEGRFINETAIGVSGQMRF